MKKYGIITAIVFAVAAIIPSCIYLITGIQGPRLIHYFMRPGIALGWLLIWGDGSGRQPIVEVAITILTYAILGLILGFVAGGIARLMRHSKMKASNKGVQAIGDKSPQPDP